MGTRRKTPNNTRPKKYSEEDVRKRVEELGFKLVSCDFKSTRSRVEYVCKKHPTFTPRTTSVNNLFKSRGCPLCNRDRNMKRTIFDVFKEFESRGYLLLTPTYESIDYLLSYVCRKHPAVVQQITYHNFAHKHGCYYCGRDAATVPRITTEMARVEFEKHGLTLLDEYKGYDLPLKYICPKHPEAYAAISYHSLKYQHSSGCEVCTLPRRGADNPRWKGGISSLSDYLRSKITPWVASSYKKYKNTCVLTRATSEVIIHHLHKNFAEIRDEVMSELNAPVYSEVGMYSENELDWISKALLSAHFKHGHGVCLAIPEHEEFHAKYGKYRNNYDQFCEFFRDKTGLDFVEP